MDKYYRVKDSLKVSEAMDYLRSLTKTRIFDSEFISLIDQGRILCYVDIPMKKTYAGFLGQQLPHKSPLPLAYTGLPVTVTPVGLQQIPIALCKENIVIVNRPRFTRHIFAS